MAILRAELKGKGTVNYHMQEGMIAERRFTILRNPREKGLMNIVVIQPDAEYTQVQYDYGILYLTELPESGATYRFVVDAEMPEGVQLGIALGPRVNQNVLYFSPGQNCVETAEMTALPANYESPRFYVRHLGGTDKVSFTIRSIQIYKL